MCGRDGHPSALRLPAAPICDWRRGGTRAARCARRAVPSAHREREDGRRCEPARQIQSNTDGKRCRMRRMRRSSRGRVRSLVVCVAWHRRRALSRARAAPGVARHHQRHRRHRGWRRPGDRAGAVAIDGTDIVAVDTPDASGGSSAAARRSMRAGQVVCPACQHAHARADGALPRPRRRSRADGLAEQYIFPAEAKTVSPEFVRAGRGWRRWR